MLPSPQLFGSKFTISVPETPQQLVTALRSSPGAAVAAACLGSALALYAVARALTSKPAGGKADEASDLGGLVQHSGLLKHQRALSAALREREEDVERTLQVGLCKPLL